MVETVDPGRRHESRPSRRARPNSGSYSGSPSSCNPSRSSSAPTGRTGSSRAFGGTSIRQVARCFLAAPLDASQRRLRRPPLARAHRCSPRLRWRSARLQRGLDQSAAADRGGVALFWRAGNSRCSALVASPILPAPARLLRSSDPTPDPAPAGIPGRSRRTTPGDSLRHQGHQSLPGPGPRGEGVLGRDKQVLSPPHEGRLERRSSPRRSANSSTH